MARFRGTDEIIVRAVELLHHGLKARHVALDQLTRRQVFLRRGLQHLDAVLVSAGEKENIAAVEPHKSRNCIRCDRLVSVPDMRRAVRIGNCGGDVIGLAGRLLSHEGWYQPRVASASRPKTLKINSFRSRL